MGRSRKSVVSRALVVAAAASSVSAHSWVVCTDYQGVKNPTTFDPAACKGWTRNAAQYVSGLFGADTGLDTQKTGCKVPRSDSNYDAKYPMATWTPGQQTCIIWPAKNHVASSKNIYIPDGGVKIYGVPYGTADPATNAGFTTLVADLGVSQYGEKLSNPDAFPRPGFQNCPGFMSNPDKAVCSQCFTVPNLSPGKYTMQWQWLFNPGTDPYVNCFDVQIAGSGGGGGATSPDPSPAVSPVASPKVSPVATANSSPIPSSTGNCVAQGNQCGGQLYTGPKTCCTGTCTVKSTYYSQCI